MKDFLFLVSTRFFSLILAFSLSLKFGLLGFLSFVFGFALLFILTSKSNPLTLTPDYQTKVLNKIYDSRH